MPETDGEIGETTENDDVSGEIWSELLEEWSTLSALEADLMT